MLLRSLINHRIHGVPGSKHNMHTTDESKSLLDNRPKETQQELLTSRSKKTCTRKKIKTAIRRFLFVHELHDVP